MNRFILFFILVSIIACHNKEKKTFTIAFGSCNNQVLENPFWNDLTIINPDIWIWGGDIIYSDTYDMNVMEANYKKQKSDSLYQKFIKDRIILGTWDDHDYGLNDGGFEYDKKKEVQQLFLDFLDVAKTDERRKKKGVYHSETYTVINKKIKIILLDTRYFRSLLTKDNETEKRYKPNVYGQGTMLGDTQWKWLEGEFKNSNADYHIIMSSIQFLSDQHGFEAWGNMPHEVEKMEKLLLKTKPKNVIFLSGDRHISEISKKEIGSEKFEIIDFTSSGLTHAYLSNSDEDNRYRISKMAHQKSFGLLKFEKNKNQVTLSMIGENNQLIDSLVLYK
jgi:alkaline phosphatase D